MTIYLEGVDFPLVLVRQVFTNKDGSVGILYLVSSDLELTYTGLTDGYRTRWHVEPYHKSLKQNAALSQSPTRTVTTQSNHLFAALCAYVKLDTLKMRTHTNHFALKAKLYLSATRSAFQSFHALSDSLSPA